MRDVIPLTTAAPSGLVFIITLGMITQFLHIRPIIPVTVMTAATAATTLSCHHEENCSDGNYP
jgi:hypothetical protein